MARPSETRFIIVCLGRTGSTHLMSLLNSHPEIRCFPEVFSPSTGLQKHFEHSDRDTPEAFVAELLGEARTPIAGFKLPWESMLAYPDTLELVQGGRFSIIRLHRRNRLEQEVSMRLAQTSGVHHSTQGDYGAESLRLDPPQVLARLRVLELLDRILDSIASHGPMFSAAYEELSEEARLTEIQEFLGADPQPLSSEYERLGGAPLQEVVDNWDEVAAALSGTRFERYLPAA